MILTASNLNKYSQIIHGFTTRGLGVDYGRIADHIKVSPSSIFTLKQIHSNKVITLSSPFPSKRVFPKSFTGLTLSQRPQGFTGRETFPHSGLSSSAEPLEVPDPYRAFGSCTGPVAPAAGLVQDLENTLLEEEDKGSKGGREVAEADAMISQDAGIVLGVRTADCVPILVFDPDHQVIAAIHAGWKGTLVGITEKTIEEMKKCYKSDPSSFIVAMGASICGNCFEVGPEVADQFREKFGERLDIPKGRENQNFVDNRQACRLVLVDCGVKPENIESILYCTHCRPDLFYSFRRRDKTERMLGFIGMIKISQAQQQF